MTARKRTRPAGGAVPEMPLEEVARLFAALSEPSRLRLLQVLLGGPATVTELVAATGFRQANVSKQLGILLAARLLGRAREGAAVRYRVVSPLVKRLCALVCEKIASDARRVLGGAGA